MNPASLEHFLCGSEVRAAFRALPTDEEDVKGMEEVDSLVTDVAATELTGVVAALVVVVIGSVVVSSRT